MNWSEAKWSVGNERIITLTYRIEHIVGINAIQSHFHTCDLARALRNARETEKTSTHYDENKKKKETCSARRSSESRMKLNISISSRKRMLAVDARTLSETNESHIYIYYTYHRTNQFCCCWCWISFFSFFGLIPCMDFKQANCKTQFMCPNGTLSYGCSLTSTQTHCLHLCHFIRGLKCN